MLLQGWRYSVVGGDAQIEKMMDQACAIRTGIKWADIVVFSGGTDVSPILYNEGYHAETQASDSERDRKEEAIYHACVAKKKLIIGICRGAQFLNVMNGGTLWQHVDNHTSTIHLVCYKSQSNEKYLVKCTSDHHQMMVPTSDARIWGWCGESRLKEGYDRSKRMGDHHHDDPEIVFYQKTKSLCFQPHPEWGVMSCAQLFQDCVRRAMT